MKIKAQIDAALTEVTAAETALDAVLRELRSGARAEKITITENVEQAFSRLRKSRVELSQLREQLDDDE